MLHLRLMNEKDQDDTHGDGAYQVGQQWELHSSPGIQQTSKRGRWKRDQTSEHVQPTKSFCARFRADAPGQVGTYDRNPGRRSPGKEDL